MALLPTAPGPDIAIGVIAAVALGCAVWAIVPMATPHGPAPVGAPSRRVFAET